MFFFVNSYVLYECVYTSKIFVVLVGADQKVVQGKGDFSVCVCVRAKKSVYYYFIFDDFFFAHIISKKNANM